MLVQSTTTAPKSTTAPQFTSPQPTNTEQSNNNVVQFPEDVEPSTTTTIRNRKRDFWNRRLDCYNTERIRRVSSPQCTQRTIFIAKLMGWWSVYITICLHMS